MINLYEDLKMCWDGLKLQHCERLFSPTVWPYLTGDGLLGYAKVSVSSGDRWDFAEDGIGCLTVAVHSDQQLVDIVAFPPSKPDQWLVRTGNGVFLGEDHLIEAEMNWNPEHIPLVVPTVLEWLHTKGQSICIVDPIPDALRRLRDLDALEVPTKEFGQVLRLQMSKPPRLPEITIVKGARDAA